MDLALRFMADHGSLLLLEKLVRGLGGEECLTRGVDDFA